MVTETEFLSAYLPATLVADLVREPETHGQPHAACRTGVLLLADIVGFTALTDELGRRGREGVEALTVLLDACFGRVVERVLEHGGDVLRFPGDAALAYWDANTDSELPQAVDRAARCALALQAAFVVDEQVTSGRQLRIAIAAGSVVTARAGGAEDRWEFVAIGRAFAELATAADQASPGATVLGPTARAALADRAQFDGRSRLLGLRSVDAAPAATRPPPPERLAPALRAYVPRPVLSHLDAGQLEWLAEFRQVSALFIELAGLGLEAKPDLETLQARLLDAQSVLYRHGGGVNQIVLDDKGLVIVAVWGCGLHTHEDDPARAIRAAIALVEALRPTLPDISAGVATGRCFCGRRGSERRSEYAVIGDPMNLAARLMKHVRGNVLCDEATATAARANVEFEELDAIELKGKPAPVAVFRPTIVRRTAVDGSVPMVGREVERRQLHDQVDALRDGLGGIVVIEGDAGIGKSRLVDDLLDYARKGRSTRD